MIRPATYDDLAEILTIYNEVAARKAGKLDNEPIFIFHCVKWFEKQARDGNPILVAAENGAVTGFASLIEPCTSPTYQNKVKHFVYVQSNQPGDGIGDQLIDSLIKLGGARVEMKKTVLHSNRNSVLFFALLSVIVFPAAVINLFDAIAGAHGYSFGVRSLLAIILPLLTYLSYRNGVMVVRSAGISIGRHDYPSTRYTFSITQAIVPLKDRPLTSLWRSNYERLVISDRASSEVRHVSLEMSRRSIEALRHLVSDLPM